jgi:tetraacyldisaccharide 4'-kinase
VLPQGASVVGVGGATLGGSYKTPLVLALARALAARGESVVVHAHGYRSTGRAARCVAAADSVRAVGDDALWLFRELAAHAVPVVVGGTRNSALGFAASLAPLVVSDSLLQTTPERLALSVLALDAEWPWGAGLCPPLGDLRASRASLLAAADVVVRVRAEGAPSLPLLDAASCPVFDATSALAGCLDPNGRLRALSSLTGTRLGVVLAIARPDRVIRSLFAHGIVPVETHLFRDHAVPRRRPIRAGRSPRPDIWLTTPKCAAKMGPTYEGAPLVVLQQRLTLPEPLLDAVLRRAPSGPPEGGLSRAGVRWQESSDQAEK